ncbi:MAG TPA: MlaD family protein [Solirubrobacteraceae bacterium]|jgi:phospholipid/cholesterol/gamma-HCH transport system substrate-binding protein|nr:MlaD family protein [Solirubrobacteraceae bacterium]
MATTSPPSLPPAPPAPGVRAPRTGPIRIIAVGALVIVVLIVAYLVFAGSGGATYKLEFAEADQLVRGNQVQVGGVPVGSVTNIELTHDYKALVTIHVDSSLVPLHQGTVAQVRVPSLASVANRYIALTLGANSNPTYPAGATLPASVTREVTDLDELFNTLNPKTRAGLAQFIQGTAEQYVGQSRGLGESTELFPAFLTSTAHFFSELTREQPVFTSFLVETAKAVTTIGARKDQLADLVENQNTTLAAIASEQSELARGLKELPRALRQGNRTFAELPATFAALKTFVETSRPTTKPVTMLLERLRPLLAKAAPVVHNLALTFSRPGADNDLTDLVRALPALAKQLTTASPTAVTTLQEAVPITAFLGPYSPDLAGTLRTFGQAAAYYDADGHYVHVSPVLPDFKLGANNTLTLPEKPEEALDGLKTGQLRRCPGAATEPAEDGSSPFVDGELLDCDPTETP